MEKDFSIFPLLHGPPRVGDTIAYKVHDLYSHRTYLKSPDPSHLVYENVDLLKLVICSSFIIQVLELSQSYTPELSRYKVRIMKS